MEIYSTLIRWVFPSLHDSLDFFSFDFYDSQLYVSFYLIMLIHFVFFIHSLSLTLSSTVSMKLLKTQIGKSLMIIFHKHSFHGDGRKMTLIMYDNMQKRVICLHLANVNKFVKLDSLWKHVNVNYFLFVTYLFQLYIIHTIHFKHHFQCFKNSEFPTKEEIDKKIHFICK